MRKRSDLADSVAKTAREIRRAPRRHYSAKESIRIVLEGRSGRAALPSCAAATVLSRGFVTAVDGVPGSRQAAAGGRYGACGDVDVQLQLWWLGADNNAT